MSATPCTHLFPISTYQTGFTTNASVRQTSVTNVDLTDSCLGVHKSSSRTRHQTVKPPTAEAPSDFPAPTHAWEASYPKGSINPTAPLPSGFSLYLSGPEWFQEKAATAKEVLWSYRLMFEKGWAWAKGGKLPGPFGGVGDAAYRCSGGRQDDRCRCFDLRLMWRANGLGEIYAYVPPLASNNDRLLAIPGSKMNPDFGISVGRGIFNYGVEGGIWKTVTTRIRLNEVGLEDGEIELYVDGESVVCVSGLVLRDEKSTDARIKGMHFQTFFGGHTPDWASPKDQKAWFADISGAIVE